MNSTKNKSLKPYNTFGIAVKAKDFVEVQSVFEIKQVLQEQKAIFLLGGGSNILLLDDVKKLVVHLNLKGKEIIGENRKHVFVKVAAGENWHEFVLWCLQKDYGGVENLAKIPGNVGTAPIQNIGAYGVEVKDSIDEVYVIEIATGKQKVFTNTQCKFGYRESIFKNLAKGKYIVIAVSFKLTQKNHKINDSYGAIQETLKIKEITEPSIQDVAEAVIEIRTTKLPDPKEIGNSGSFFKNPVISSVQFKALQNTYPDIPNYPTSNSKLVKLAAGWLIDQCHFKGKRIGDAGVHKDQALVLVNYGSATGKEILLLAKTIQKSVKTKFGVDLEMEVNIV